MTTPEQIAKRCDHLDGKANRAAINKIYRENDESDKWPICNKFDATERAIRRVRTFERDSGCYLLGLEYAYAIDEQISEIVKNESNW